MRPDAGAPTLLDVSVVVLARDEEEALPATLAPLVARVGEVLVVDSESTDATRQVARAAGARVVVQPWLGFGRQRNRGAELAAHDWVFQVDADEVVGEDLLDALEAALAQDPPPEQVFSVHRSNLFMGAVLPSEQRRSKIATFVRAYHRGATRYDEAIIHEGPLYSSVPVLLDGTMVHGRGESLGEIFARVNENTSAEAVALSRRPGPVLLGRLVALPLARLGFVLLARGGLSHGYPGVVHAFVLASADVLRSAKAIERRVVGGDADQPSARYVAPR